MILDFSFHTFPHIVHHILLYLNTVQLTNIISNISAFYLLVALLSCFVSRSNSWISSQRKLSRHQFSSLSKNIFLLSPQPYQQNTSNLNMKRVAQAVDRNFDVKACWSKAGIGTSILLQQRTQNNKGFKIALDLGWYVLYIMYCFNHPPIEILC